MEPADVVVMLTRMEGSINLVLQRMEDLVPRVGRAEGFIATLQRDVQRLDLDAKASEAKAIALAAALKEAKAASESEDNKAWTPVQRLAAIVALALVAIQIYQALKGQA